VGDTVDNVPGVPTIGPKTASGLLQTYGTLENVLEHADEIPGAKGEKIAEGREMALLSRELVRLDRHVPIVLDWNASRVGGLDHQRLTELFSEFGFRSFGERAARIDPGAGTVAAASTAAQADYQLVDTPAKLAKLVATLAKQSLISVDTETTHIMPRWAEIVGYSFAYRPGEAFYVPVRGPAGDAVLDPQATLDALRPVLENPAIAKIGQNLKYDMIVLRNAGVELAGAVFDTMVASSCLTPASGTTISTTWPIATQSATIRSAN
jgi:DNA polymerase-1